MKKFEYKRMRTNQRLSTSELNKLGSDGWELMKEEVFIGSTFKDSACFYLFKREII